jgi:hypothetical protein
MSSFLAKTTLEGFPPRLGGVWSYFHFFPFVLARKEDMDFVPPWIQAHRQSNPPPMAPNRDRDRVRSGILLPERCQARRSYFHFFPFVLARKEDMDFVPPWIV